MRHGGALLAATGPVIPNFSAHSSKCVVQNHFFCPDWVSHNWGPILWPALRSHILLTLVAVTIGFAISLVLALAAYRYGWLERPTIAKTRRQMTSAASADC